MAVSQKRSCGGEDSLVNPRVVMYLYSYIQADGPPTDGGGQGFLPQVDEFYFTTDEKKISENCRYIVPNFMND